MSRLMTEIVVPSEFEPHAKQLFADELYEAHAHIFDGVDKESFVKYVIDSNAEHTAIQIHRNGEGRIVGYCAIHIFEKNLRSEPVAIIRGEAGILREYRGANAIMRFFVGRVVRYVASHPGRRIYYLGSLVHPSSYAQIARLAHRVWPNPAGDIPAEIATVMGQMAGEFHLERAVDRGSLVCKIGWRTRDSSNDRAYWATRDDPAVQFFLRANPGYVEGHGLLTLVPLTLAGMLRTVTRLLAYRAKRWVEKSRTAMLPERGLRYC